jgi:hypothetical protein
MVERRALAGGVYAAACAADAADAPDMLLFAASRADGGHAAAVAAALLGARFGLAWLPVPWLARLELVWVGDTLARDLVRQLADSPPGDGYTAATEATWWDRYPGC